MIKYLKYKGEELPVRLSYAVIKRLKDKFGDKDLNNLDFESFEFMLFWGLESGSKAKGVELKLKQEDMEDVLDEVFTEFINMIPEFFNFELPKGASIPEQKQAVEKK